MNVLHTPYRATSTFIPRRGAAPAEVIWRAPETHVPELLPWIEAHGLDPSLIKAGHVMITDDGTTKMLHVTEFLTVDGRVRVTDYITGQMATRPVVVPLIADPPVPGRD